MAARILYTRYARSHDKLGLTSVSTAAPPVYSGEKLPSDTEKATGDEASDKETAEVTATSIAASSDSITTLPSMSIAIFPQYIAPATTTLIIREFGLPQFSNSFQVTNDTTSTDLFNIHRERPAIGWRQHITDAMTNAPIMTLRRNLGQLPVSYCCLDAGTEAKLLELQGNFFLPFTGSESTASFLDATTGDKVELEMKGSYRNRHATVKNRATAEVLVTMESEVLELRNAVGGRRTYKVAVKEGMDMCVAVALIIALDARAD